MLKQFMTTWGQTLLTPRGAFAQTFLRSTTSAAASVETTDSANTDKKPLPARRAEYKSPPRDLLFGIHPVEIALAEKRRIFYKLFVKKRNGPSNERVDDIKEWATNLKIPIKYKYGREMSFLVNDAVHQGVILQASRLKFVDWSEQMEIFGKSDDEGKLLVYLDQIQDPMNLGAVLRSCIFLGVDTILVPTQNSCKFSTTVSKASSGALECASICTVEDPHKFMTFVKNLGWDILGTDSDCLPYDKYEVTTKNRLLVLGNEGHGVNEELVNFFTSTVSVPGVNNRVGSLNVSVTAGILLSHFTKPKRMT